MLFSGLKKTKGNDNHQQGKSEEISWCVGEEGASTGFKRGFVGNLRPPPPPAPSMLIDVFGLLAFNHTLWDFAIILGHEKGRPDGHN